MTRSIVMPEATAGVLETLHSAGHEAYIVGGCVRDALLGRDPKDWDITTSASPQEVKSLFRRTIDTGIQHGTVTVMVGKTGYEVTTYRVDGDYLDGRHPSSVSFTKSLPEDLKRRDFTINAMAYSPREGVIDLFDGISDLRAGVIRAVGNPRQRFQEDALRILRAIRFSAQLDFAVEEETLSAIRDFAPRLALISRERIRVEVDKLLCSDHPERFDLLRTTGITQQIFPKYDAMMEMPQNNPWHRYSVGEHTLHTVCGVPADPVLRWSALLHDVGKLETRTTDEKGIDHFYHHASRSRDFAKQFLRDLRFDNATIDLVALLVRLHDIRFDGTARSVRRAMNRVGAENFPRLLTLIRADAMAKSESAVEFLLPGYDIAESLYRETLEAEHCTSLKELAVTGRDLIAAGIKPGPKLGEVLQQLLDAVIEDPSLNERATLLAAAEEYRRSLT